MSFKIGRVCSDGGQAIRMNKEESWEAAIERAVRLHIEYMDCMIYLRLLSTPQIVASAERLHSALDLLLDHTFRNELIKRGHRPFYRGAIPDGLGEQEARSACTDYRERLINHAREYLGLPADMVIDRTM